MKIRTENTLVVAAGNRHTQREFQGFLVVDWGRSSFARCLIEIDSKDALKESITIGVPYIDSLGFYSETIRVEYEWKPPRCDVCLIFGHSGDTCSKKVVPTPVVEKSNDGFQQVVNKKGKNKKDANNKTSTVVHGVPVGKNMQYRPKATTKPSNSTSTQGEASTSNGPPKQVVNVSTSSVSNSSKPNVSTSDTIPTRNSSPTPKVTSPNLAANVSTSNTFEALLVDEDGDANLVLNDEGEEVLNTFDESSNFFFFG